MQGHCNGFVKALAVLSIVVGLTSSCASIPDAGGDADTAVVIGVVYLEPDEGGAQPSRVSLVLEDDAGRISETSIALDEPYHLIAGVAPGRYRLVGHRIARRRVRPVKMVEFEVQAGRVTLLPAAVRVLASREGPWAATVTTRPLQAQANEEIRALLAADVRLAGLRPAP